MSDGAQITLFTGLPGAGKTALVVSMLRKEVERGRLVYCLGIPGLKLEHLQPPPVAEWCHAVPLPEDPALKEWRLTLPDGCLLLIDEAQKIFRPRPTGSQVPPLVQSLETHRHKGIDIWLITQSHTFVDSNVRKLVNRHIHVRNHWSGRSLFEMPRAFDPDSKADRDISAKRKYRLPKDAFALYTSSSKHVKNDRRIPTFVYALPLILFLVAYLGWSFYSSRFAEQSEPVVASVDKGAPTNRATAQPAPMGGESRTSPGQADPVADWLPRITTRPESAPMYDKLRQVKALPYVAGCAAIRDRCTCYTPQGTDAFLTPDQCREWMRKPPFNPWLEAPAPTSIPASQKTA